MFEIKYNRDGEVIKDPRLEEQLEKAKQEAYKQQGAPVEAQQAAPAEQVQAQETVTSEPQEVQKESLPLETQAEVRNTEQPEVQQVAESNPVKESFKALRDKKEKAERERDELLRRLQGLEAQQQIQQPLQQQNNKAAPDQDINITINDDDIVEGKHLKEILKEQQRLKQQVKQYEQTTAQATIEARLKSQYPDIEKVITEDNILLLKEIDPVEFEGISSIQNQYTQAVMAYRRIKEKGIYQDKTYDVEKQIAQRNAAKPKPLASISPTQSDSPLTHANAFANGLTPDLQKQLWKEMEDIRRAS